MLRRLMLILAAALLLAGLVATAVLGDPPSEDPIGPCVSVSAEVLRCDARSPQERAADPSPLQPNVDEQPPPTLGD